MLPTEQLSVNRLIRVDPLNSHPRQTVLGNLLSKPSTVANLQTATNLV